MFKKDGVLLDTVQTNTQGIATYSYASTGAGDITFSAECDFLSEIYEVTDCYKADSGMTDYSNIWIVLQVTLSRDGDYSTLTESTTGTTGAVTIINIPLTSYRIECDVYQIDGTRNEWFLTVLKNDYTPITSRDMVLGEWTHIVCDLNNIEANSRIRLNTGGTCTTLRFRNFKLYPI